MSDLTIIYLTANQHPRHYAAFHKKMLIKAAEEHPLITVSRKPLDFGINILDTGPKSHINMYYQLLQAAKTVKTDYIATAEDDALYPPEHYNFYRPPLDSFAYNMHRWSLFTWKPNFYSIKMRKSNCTLIAPTKLLIEAWEERFAKYPLDKYPKRLVGELGRPNIDQWLGVTVRNSIEVYSDIGVVHINHPNGTDSLGTRKKPGEIKAIEIPYWGRAEDLVKEYR